MNRVIAVVATLAVCLVWTGSAEAQFGVPMWSQPAPVVVAPPVVVGQPMFVAPPVVMAPQVVMAPSVVSARPVIVSSSPVVVQRAPIITYQPTREIVTRHRPILGGTVTRVRYGYRRVAF
jgi:hypothetical protein